MDTIIIYDFGSQYTQLIARRVRESNVFCEIIPFHSPKALSPDVKGVILSGSPFSVLDKDAPQFPLETILGKCPVLAICYGAQYIAHKLGGSVFASNKREYGRARLVKSRRTETLLEELNDDSQVWMSHGDTIQALPEHFTCLASTKSIKNAAFKANSDHFPMPVYGLQFHPEVTHSIQGSAILKSFVLDVCKCKPDWTPASFASDMIMQLQSQIKDERVVLGLSGGVDSTVAAILLHKAIGKNLYCIFVDNGLLRKDEFVEVLHAYREMGLNIKGVDAGDRFLKALKDISDPEQKRKVIGSLFIDVFQEEAHHIQDVKWLAQGTIYPDVIESISVHGPSVTIKSHHNVGGLPEKMHLKVVEPLRMLFKDEVRKVGNELLIDPAILTRHPFPGPGLGVRILGSITREKVRVLQEADKIYIDNLHRFNLYHKIWQACTILLPVQSVGVMGDERTYENVVALRAVNSLDGMTADWSHLPFEFLAQTSNDIINKVKGVNRVVYDISSKPPATIEWE